MREVAKHHPESFECVVVEQLPFEEYMEVVQTANVVVDQVYSDAQSRNALFSMARGRVVFTDFVRQKVGELDFRDVPAQQLTDLGTNLVASLLVLRQWSSDDFVEQGRLARRYVEENCAPSSVARKLMEYWGNAP